MSNIRKLIVEVIDARDLQPKDEHGTSSPCVVLDYYGQRRRTLTAVRTLNPTWNEKLDFNAGKASSVFEDVLKVEVYHDKLIGPTSRNNFLGRLRLNASQFVSSGEEGLLYYTLEKKHLFNWIKGELGLKIYYADEEIPPPPAAVEEVKPPAEEPKPAEEAPAVAVELPSNVSEKPSEEQEPPPPPLPPPPPENAAAEVGKPPESEPAQQGAVAGEDPPVDPPLSVSERLQRFEERVFQRHAELDARLDTFDTRLSHLEQAGADHTLQLAQILSILQLQQSQPPSAP